MRAHVVRLSRVVVALLLLGSLFVGGKTALHWWTADGELLTKAAGNLETSGPEWPGYGKILYSDLSSQARVQISAEDLKTLTTWTAVCAAFQKVEHPAPGQTINSIVLPAVDLGTAVTGAAEIVVVREWSGWKLAKVSCLPRAR